jgi:hypothetical protein
VIQAYFNQVKAIVDPYAATSFVLDANVSLEMRPGDRDILPAQLSLRMAQRYISGSSSMPLRTL